MSNRRLKEFLVAEELSDSVDNTSKDSQLLKSNSIEINPDKRDKESFQTMM